MSIPAFGQKYNNPIKSIYKKESFTKMKLHINNAQLKICAPGVK